MKKIKANQSSLFSQKSGSGTKVIASSSPKLASDCIWRREALPAKTERVQGIHAFFFNKERLSDPEILRQLLIGYPNFISSSLFS